MAPYVRSVESRFIENVGREAHTYLWYILQEWERLPDAVVFVQAEFADLFKNNEWRDTYYSLVERMVRGALRSGVFMDQTKDVREYRDLEVFKRYKDHALVPWAEGDNRIGVYARERLGWDVWHESVPERVWVHWGGIQAAAGWSIRQRPRETYEAMFADARKHRDTLVAHWLERLWVYVLGRHLVPVEAVVDASK